MMQSCSHEYDYFIYCIFFLPAIALRETNSISNIACFINSFQHDRLQRQKRKRNKEYNQTRSVFYI